VRQHGAELDDVMARGASSSSRVQSVERAVDLLKAVAASRRPGGSTVVELARTCDLNRATAWRLLTTLERQGMVTRHPATGQYTIGPAVPGLMSSRSAASLVEVAQPVLERLSLETGEIACFGMVEGDTVHYVAEVIPSILCERSWIGEPVALHASSMGKAVLAFLDEDRVASVVGSSAPAYTPSTITDLDTLRHELRRVRSLGYALCMGEYELGSWGVAAPVFTSAGTPAGALCLWGPDTRGDRARLTALGRLARRAANEISAA
jgi:IclR family transcriptional regulator, acetate operon repressor